MNSKVPTTAIEKLSIWNTHSLGVLVLFALVLFLSSLYCVLYLM